MLQQFIYFALAIMIGIIPPESSKDYTIHAVAIKKGDGMWSLLRRYNLNHSECNIEQFYEMNKLDKNSYLQADKKYKLPVYIYKYDGKSIRSTIGQDDWDKAIRIKEYNENLLSKGLRKSNYLDSKILWVPHHEINCEKSISEKISKEKTVVIKEKEAKKEVTKTSIIDDLYGKKYRETEIFDKTLEGKVFYVVSGHGGPDSGARCKEYKDLLCEDEYAYDVALRLARNLTQHGAMVEMVVQDNDGIRDGKFLPCDYDERMANGAKLPLSQRTRLKQRTVYVNNKYVEYQKEGYYDQYLISLHVDSRSSNHEQDVFFCHYKESNGGRKLATALQNKFKQKYDHYQKNRGYHGHIDERNFYVLMNTAPPAVLIELANIQNKSDHRRILEKENRQALANWIYEGLSEHALNDSQEHVATP